MICPNCKEAGILNHANGIEFYYCRTCKIEIFLEDAPKIEEDKDGNKKEDDLIKYPWGYFDSLIIPPKKVPSLSDTNPPLSWPFNGPEPTWPTSDDIFNNIWQIVQDEFGNYRLKNE